MAAEAGRRVVAWASVSMDGCASGPGGPAHDQWLYDHAGQEQTSTYFEGIWRAARTALLGRTVLGGGLRLLPEGLPASSWELARPPPSPTVPSASPTAAGDQDRHPHHDRSP